LASRREHLLQGARHGGYHHAPLDWIEVVRHRDDCRTDCFFRDSGLSLLGNPLGQR